MYRLLRYQRENAKLNQTELGKLLNIKKSQYSLYETETVTIPIKHLITLCNYFNVSLDYIFEFSKIKQYKNLTKEVNKIEAGKRLKKFRKNLNLNQTELAEILNTTFSTISSYERGVNLISTNYLYFLSTKYKISADYLLGRIDIPQNISK